MPLTTTDPRPARGPSAEHIFPEPGETATAAAAQLLLVVEDIDVPLAKPAVHCLALIDPTAGHLDPGALSARHPGPGVRVLRSTVGRGYHGPAPVKGHGPHRYVFQLFALQTPPGRHIRHPTGGPSPPPHAPAVRPRARPRPRPPDRRLRTLTPVTHSESATHSESWDTFYVADETAAPGVSV